MGFTGFGKIVYRSLSAGEKGFLIHETRTGVVLEKRTESAYVVVKEYNGARIKDEAFLGDCLAEAREYVGDKNTPIYVDLNPWEAAINQV